MTFLFHLLCTHLLTWSMTALFFTTLCSRFHVVSCATSLVVTSLYPRLLMYTDGKSLIPNPRMASATGYWIPGFMHHGLFGFSYGSNLFDMYNAVLEDTNLFFPSPTDGDSSGLLLPTPGRDWSGPCQSACFVLSPWLQISVVLRACAIAYVFLL